MAASPAPRPQSAEPLPYRFLGTSGQNVSDIFRYSSMEDHLEILEWTLRVRHISPTAPDTLGIYSATLVGSRVRDGFPAQPCIQKSCFGIHSGRFILSRAKACTIQTSIQPLLPLGHGTTEHLSQLGCCWHSVRREGPLSGSAQQQAFLQGATPSTKPTRSSFRNALMSTSVATPPALVPKSSEVSLIFWGLQA